MRLGQVRLVAVAQRLGQRERRGHEVQPAHTQVSLVGLVDLHAQQAPEREPHRHTKTAPDHQAPHRRLSLAREAGLLRVAHRLGQHEHRGQAEHIAHHHERPVQRLPRQVGQPGGAEKDREAERHPHLELPGAGVAHHDEGGAGACHVKPREVVEHGADGGSGRLIRGWTCLPGSGYRSAGIGFRYLPLVSCWYFTLRSGAVDPKQTLVLL
ncbi:hypothetical protein FQZ97_938020 [compost metagenome]